MIKKLTTDRYEMSFTKYLNKDTGEEYGRIIGGIGWPHKEKPGFAVVVSEEYSDDRDRDWRKLTVLSEMKDSDLGNLLKRCQEATKKYQVLHWYGDTGRKSMMDLFNHINTKWGTERIFLSAAKNIDDTDSGRFYLEILRGCMRPAQKTLYFLEDSLIKADYAQLGLEEIEKPIAESPGLAALGYAVSFLRTTPFPKPYRKKQRKGTTWMSV